MSESLFNAADLIRMAIEDERAGKALYAALSKKVSNQELKKTFQSLLEQEKVHQAAFEKMLAEYVQSPMHEEYAGQYMEYLRVLLQERAIPNEASALAEAGKCADDHAALGLASQMERDTLMLFHELESLLPPNTRHVMDAVALEERQHLITLAQARRNLP